MKTFLNISELHYRTLRAHLFPGDHKEAVAIALCGRSITAERRGLIVHELIPIPYDQCHTRAPDLVHWSTELVKDQLEKARKKHLSVVKIHCHPDGPAYFSHLDTQSDLELFDSVYGWVNDDGPHVSLIMLPDGKLFGRFIEPDLSFTPIDRVRRVGDDLHFWDHQDTTQPLPEQSLRSIQAFGEGTIGQLQKMRIAVVGCSGTGSPVIEQLARFGVGELYLIDPDRIEVKNLNRILNATMEDAIYSSLKVDVQKSAIEQMGFGTKVHTYAHNLYDDLDLLRELASFDFIFGCVDSVDGRHLLNTLATFYCIPYLDLGVKLLADGRGGIDHICSTVHYLQPGESLLERGVYSAETLRATSLHRANPQEYERLQKEGYIANLPVDSPAVISVNMQVAALAVQELLARIHHFRYPVGNHSGNKNFAIQRWDSINGTFQHFEDNHPKELLAKYIGRGDLQPFLNLPEFSPTEQHLNQLV